MAASDRPAAPATSREIVLTRVFDAPRRLVWKAWSESEHFQRWWGPKEFTAPDCRMDFRVGGIYHWCMRSPEGKDYWTTGKYLEIIEPERIVYTDLFADAEGNAVPASYYHMPGDWPMETLVTVTFEERNGKTTMTLRHEGIPAGTMREMAGAGWNESFDKLAATLK